MILNFYRAAFWISVVLIGGFLLYFNRSAPTVIETFYQQGNFDLLNQLSASRGQHELDFYTGRIEDVCLGPFTNVMGFVFFGLFCFLYLRQETKTKVFSAFVFIFFLITKFNVLTFPFYGDAIGGPFAEGYWLAQNNFNYTGLYHEPGYEAGGPKVYFFSIYPTYLALLLKLIPSPTGFLIVNHLLVFLMASVVTALTRQFLLKIFDNTTSTLGAILLLSTALFQSQAEAINMEMPSLFFSMLAIHHLLQKRIGWASGFAIVAALVKGHAIIICATVFIVSLFLFSIDEKFKRKWPIIVYGLLCLAISFLLVGGKFLLKDQHASAGMIRPGVGWSSLQWMPITYIYLLSLIVLMGMLVKKFREKTARSEEFFSKQYYEHGVIFLAAGMWFVLFLNFLAVSPRYMLELTPFLVMSTMIAFSFIPILRSSAPYLLMIAIFFASLGSFGMFHRPLSANYHVLSERSLEYRNDLKLNRRLAEILTDKFPGFTVGAPFLLAQSLAIPELGYVKKPLSVMVYGMPITYGNIKNFEELKKVDIMRTIWVGVAADFDEKGGYTYPVSSYDKVIKKVRVGNNWAELFMGGVAIEYRKQIVRHYYDWLKLQKKSQ